MARSSRPARQVSVALAPFRWPEVAAISFCHDAATLAPRAARYSPLSDPNREALGLRQLPSTTKIFRCDYDLARAPRRAISTTLFQTRPASYTRDELKRPRHDGIVRTRA